MVHVKALQAGNLASQGISEPNPHGVSSLTHALMILAAAVHSSKTTKTVRIYNHIDTATGQSA